MKSVLLFIGIMTIMGSMQEHKRKPCPEPKIIIKWYKNGKVTDFDIPNGGFVMRKLPPMNCGWHNTTHYADSIDIGFVK